MSKPIKRGDKWRMQIMINGVRESATFDTKREALAWADQRRMELRGGATPSTARTLHQMIDKYIAEVAPLRRGGEFEIKRLRLMKNRLRDSRLDAMSAETFSKWRDARLQEVSAGTVLRDMGVLRSVFSCARRDWGWKFEDVLKDVRRPPAPPSRDRLITAQEIAIMLDRLNYSPEMKATLKSQQTAVAFIIALESAMRVGEILALTWDRVDLDTRVATLDVTKNGEKRGVPLSPRAVQVMKQLASYGQGGKLFDLAKGTRDAIFRKARKAAGLEGFTFHDSRANATTALLEVFNQLELARITGHKDPRKLKIYYRKSAAELAKKLADER